MAYSARLRKAVGAVRATLSAVELCDVQAPEFAQHGDHAVAADAPLVLDGDELLIWGVVVASLREEALDVALDDDVRDLRGITMIDDAYNGNPDSMRADRKSVV